MNDTGPPADHLLSVRDLRVRFATTEGQVHAVNGLSFDLDRGETLAIVGESGSGKSVTSLAVMGLLPWEATVEGSVRLRGRELVGLRDREMRRIRGSEIAMVFQDAMASLDPVFTVGDQIVEAIRSHHPDVSKREARDRAVDLLEIVGIAAAGRSIDSYPHEMSGGMRQRVMIAIAIANGPDVLIADEPTTALDVTIQAQVMEALAAAQEATGAATVLITHDLGLVASYADRVQVMYGGFAFESAPTDEIFYRSRNPYTLGLLDSIPRADRRGGPLRLIRGAPPNAILRPVGCAFQPRCDRAEDICSTDDPPLVQVEPGHLSRCHFALDITPGHLVEGSIGAGAGTARAASPTEIPEDEPPILEIIDLVKHFPPRARFLARSGEPVRAVNGVTLRVARRESLGIVGESGSGKSTLARCILRLIEPTSGTIRYQGRDLTEADARTMRELRRDLQLVFQDPYASLNPRMTVDEIIREPLVIHHWSKSDARDRVRELLTAVGLAPEHARRYPHEFSGGQRQRIGIARALALGPGVILLDEPVSALDVSVQAQVLNMLADLQSEFELSLVYIAHDLSVVRHVSDRVAVMYLGKVVESAASEEVYSNPAHPYTQSLLSAVPIPDPRESRTRRRIILGGDIPDPSDLPTGCTFHTRCPVAQPVCSEVEPRLEEVAPGHVASCHFPLAVGERLEDRLAKAQSAPSTNE